MPKDTLDLEAVVKAVDEVKTTFEAFKASNDERMAEAIKGTVDPLLTERMKKIDEDLNAKQEIIDQLFTASKRKKVTLDGKDIDVADLDAKALCWAQMCATKKGTQIHEYTHENAREYEVAFNRYLRKDDRVLTPDEQKALSVGSDPDGGYVVSPDASGRIVQRMFETSPVRAWASTQLISTDALEGIHDVDEAASGWVGETASRPETNTPQLDVWRIPVHEQYAEPRATQKLLDDAFIDMEAWLANKVADVFTRTENTAFITGAGTAQPRGIATYPDRAVAATFELGAIEQFDTGANGAFAADPNGPDVLYNTIYGTIATYRQNAAWFMNRTTMGAVRLLQDSNGAYQWQPSVVAGQPSTLAGYPVASFEDMADFSGTGALAICFGDMAAAYQIVDRIGIRVLRDPYTTKPFVKFYTTKRVGGDVVNFEAIKFINFQA
jgi:HK97 family phage major capsid protein